MAQQQMVEIARALSKRARILILDEPTASLSDTETEALFAKLRGLSRQGVGIIYISHRLEEINGWPIASRFCGMGALSAHRTPRTCIRAS
jgi:ABC-type sugar transport system ATPase subunit